MKLDPQITGTPAELTAMTVIIHERDRQKTEEKWSPEHDDGHVDGSLWQAAFFYASLATTKNAAWAYSNFKRWPWSPECFKPWKKGSTEIDRERCLVKAGALIIAEQERLERALQKVLTRLSELQSQKTNVP